MLEIDSKARIVVADTPESVNNREQMRFKPPNWLPELVPQSVLRDIFSIHLPSLTRRCRKETATRVSKGISETIAEWRRMLDEGVVKNRAELARRVGVSRARVTKALGPISQ